PRLLPRIALPVAAFALEVLLHCRERQGDPARVAERPQSQVDAMAESLGGHFVEQPRELLAESGEVILRRKRALAVGLTVAVIGVDKVHVRGEIQLAAAELA